MSRGSEHTLNGKHYAAEMHIIHYDYSSEFVPEAILAENGLPVLGIWINQGRYNPTWEPIMRQLCRIRHNNNRYAIDTTLSISSLLPEYLTCFYRYRGSLTIPGCCKVSYGLCLKLDCCDGYLT